ncbi:hypothetical protein ES332_D10G204500v1 [Gossypium tomentosum]|uniref:Uncharacterized protein n=1 Tax=Gossypium tomentosum TaxID=34277 RepID=A0A5D2J677_GOSTO|nr:hypothetical protein ES332_D10G204500v1 [Gossypium tomentosum]TYH50408.1 hypothetical protein ES332_D10G204500v1 [Gossypium tomentosum]TYH50409.1 hypothetical protein ES332_D10G204500v1 [Gossypium tomentosum]TYH50410.1 hypothetical protein ES332_D10G204500v1 [Gossypium tomentosum]
MQWFLSYVTRILSVNVLSVPKMVTFVHRCPRFFLPYEEEGRYKNEGSEQYGPIWIRTEGEIFMMITCEPWIGNKICYKGPF